MILNKRSLAKIMIDGIAWSLITYVAFYLRLENAAFKNFNDIMLLSAIIIPVKFLIVIFNGHYKISWRYSSFSDFIRPSLSILIFTLIYYLIIALSYERLLIPRTVPAIDAALTIIAFLAIRIMAQIVNRFKKSNHDEPHESKNVIIAGAGESGTMIAKEMHRQKGLGMNPIGFLDDDPDKQNQRISGIPMLGKIPDLKKVIAATHPDEIIIAMPSESGKIIREIFKTANEANIDCRTIPGLQEIISGVVSIEQLRKVQVEDLLRRKPVKLNTENIAAYLKGKRILVSGAGGSIGSEIVRQIKRYFPEQITLVGRGENSIHEIYRECMRQSDFLKVDAKITDLRDKRSLEKIFQEAKPEVVFHAAAHKHVYLMERNPAQAILNNVIGTKNLVDLSLKYKVNTFVNISTDKAINPTSVMGASKRIAEFIVENASTKINDSQSYVSVRFGNVLGSRGSVVPIFKEQIRRGGPITITHPDMVRYFMTIPEASQLVLQAGALKMNGAVFVLDMGEPVKIVDMARDLIRLSGLEPDIDIKIQFTGIRPGEKLFEELLNAEEGSTMTQHEKIFIARQNGSIKDLDTKLDKLFAAAESGDELQIRKMIKNIVPTYSNGGIKKEEDSRFKTQDSK